MSNVASTPNMASSGAFPESSSEPKHLHSQPKLMQFLNGLDLAVGGVLLAAALLHLTLAFKGHQRQLSVTFAMTSLFASGEAFGAPLRQSAQSVEEFVFWLKITMGCMLIFTVSLVWFARAYAKLPGWAIPALFTFCTSVGTAVYLYVPYTLFFSERPALRQIRLPWNETVVIGVGSPHRWMLASQIAVFSCIAYTIAAGVRLWRRGDRRRAASYTLGLAPLIFLVYPYGILVNRGVIAGPYLYAFAFLGFVVVMSVSLLNEAAERGVLEGN